jgi:tetratricopeptide (TPR) repeat protein/8-oxo-dGTP pyrophosphatase MutT (NUDIX family)
MRTSVASIALFRRPGSGGAAQYLAQWNERWNSFHFVGGHRESGESFRTCCIREIAEELGLQEGRDIRIADEPAAHLEYVAYSANAGAETAYTMELFDAELLGDTAGRVEADLANRWLSEADIRARRCRDGRAVSETMFRLLTLAGLTPGEFDLFVSYAHRDDHDGWVTALLDAIRAEHAAFTNVPLRIFFDREAIHSMDDWEHRILTGLRSAKVMLAVLSPNYVASAFCRREWEAYVDHELSLALPGDGIAPIYTMTVPGFEDDAAAALDRMLANLRQRQYIDARPWRAEGIAALRREDVRQRLQLLDQEIDGRLQRAARVAASTSHHLPRHNPNFVGRHDELRRLREVLACGRVGAIAAVQGIGGIGKTALAFEYAHGFAHEYPGGRYVLRAEGVADFRAAVVDQLRSVLGIELSEDEKRSYDLSFPRIWAALQARGPALLVLDNLDQPELLRGAKRAGILPAGDRVHVVTTTRLEPALLEDREHVQCLLLDALPAEDGLRLLRGYRETAGDEEWKAALAIVHRLGGHALALEVVGVFLWKNPEVSYRDYLARLEAEGIGAVEGAAGDERVELSRHPEKFIGRLLEPTLAKLTPVELRALEYASQLPADAAPLPWLQALLEQDRPAEMEQRPGYPDPWQQVVRRLEGLRLLVREPKEPRLARMHRVVRDVVVARLEPEEAAARQAQATEHARKRAAFLWEGWVKRESRWEIEPVYLQSVKLMREAHPAGAALANQIHHPLWLLGRLTEARNLLRCAIGLNEKAYEADHPTLAISYSNLAAVEQDLGHLDEARDLLRRAIAIDAKAYEADYPILAIRYSILALVEQGLGHLDEAHDLLRRAIAIDEKAYEADHPTLAIRYSNLATVEQDLGHLDEAGELLRRAIAIEEKAYDTDHPTLANSYSNLATVEYDLGHLEEAGELLRRAIAIQEKAYEADHPKLAISYSNLAAVEQHLGHLEEAGDLLRRAIAIQEKAYEADHPKLAIRYWNLAQVEQADGHLMEAIALVRRAARIWRLRLGETHPNTQRAVRWLAEHDSGPDEDAD